jgi:hypothetical protein
VEEVIEAWERQGKAEPTCQLLIDFSYLNSTSPFLRMQNSLCEFGFHLDTCLTEDDEVYGRCTFFSTIHCPLE